jgi:hypothetical protein
MDGQRACHSSSVTTADQNRKKQQQIRAVATLAARRGPRPMEFSTVPL